MTQRCVVAPPGREIPHRMYVCRAPPGGGAGDADAPPGTIPQHGVTGTLAAPGSLHGIFNAAATHSPVGMTIRVTVTALCGADWAPLRQAHDRPTGRGRT